MKLLKWIVGLALGLAVVLLAMVLLLPLFFDAEDFRKDIEQGVSTQLGRDVTIGGEIDWSVFPWLALEVGEVQIANAEGFEAPYLAAFGRARASVRLVPLFRGEVQVGEVSLSGLDLRLERDANGDPNWMLDFEATTDAEPKGGPGSGEDLGFEVRELRVTNGRVQFVDRSQEPHVDLLLSEWELIASDVAPEASFPIKTSLLLRDEQTETDLRVAVRGRSSGLLSASPALSDVTVELEANRPAFASPATLTIDAPTLSATTIELDDWLLRFADLEAGGAIEAQLEPELSGQASLQTNRFRLQQVLESAEIPAEALGDSFGLFQAQAQARWEGATVWLSQLQMGSDNTTITGDAEIGIGPNPSLRFTLAADVLALDDFVAAEDQAASPESTGEIRSEDLRFGDIEGTITVGTLSIAGVRANDLTLKVKADDQQLRLYPLEAEIYDGELMSELTLDLRSELPQLVIDQNWLDIETGALAQVWLSRRWVEGLGSVRLSGAGRASGSDALLRSFDGRLRAQINDGAVLGIDLEQLFSLAASALSGELLQSFDPAKRTRFETLEFAADIKQGVATLPDIKLESPWFRIDGAGTIALADLQTDLSLGLAIRKLPANANPIVAQLQDVPIPLKVRGTPDALGFEVDLATALVNSQQGRLKDLQQELGSEVFSQLGLDGVVDEAAAEDILGAVTGAPRSTSQPSADASEPSNVRSEVSEVLVDTLFDQGEREDGAEREDEAQSVKESLRGLLRPRRDKDDGDG